MMATIDDATAARIAKHLRDTGLAPDLRAAGDYDGLAKAIQEAAEPPAPKPGLYFVLAGGDADVHLEELAHRRDGYRWRDLLWGYDVERTRPAGKIVSGPHTCEELLEAAQK